MVRRKRRRYRNQAISLRIGANRLITFSPQSRASKSLALLEKRIRVSWPDGANGRRECATVRWRNPGQRIGG
jgi:hypothetical protein